MTIRTRSDKGKTGIMGNNDAGRKGKLSCPACRKIRHKVAHMLAKLIQCEYNSIWQTCECCKTKNSPIPCIKVNRQQFISRQIPTAIDAPAGSADDALLGYAYTNDSSIWCVSALFRLLAKAYGPGISSVSLRHAMLAFSASRSSNFQYLMPMYEQKTMTIIRGKRSERTTIEHSDVFAVFLIAWIRWKNGDFADAQLHAADCLSMVELWPNRGDLFTMLVPFISSSAGQIRTASSMNGQWIPPNRIPFEQRLAYSAQLALFSHRMTVPRLEAAFNVCSDVFYMLVRCIRRISTEPTSELDQRTLVRDVLCFVNSELDDVDFQHAMATFGILFDESGILRVPIGNPQITDWFFNTCTCIRLMTSMIKAPTVLERLDTLEVHDLAKSLAVSCQYAKTWYGYDQTYGVPNYHSPHLLLAGIGLEKQDNHAGIPPPNLH